MNSRKMRPDHRCFYMQFPAVLKSFAAVLVVRFCVLLIIASSDSPPGFYPLYKMKESVCMVEASIREVWYSQ
jgi:hypothetical protein